jgi:hypothetical protein
MAFTLRQALEGIRGHLQHDKARAQGYKFRAVPESGRLFGTDADVTNPN